MGNCSNKNREKGAEWEFAWLSYARTFLGWGTGVEGRRVAKNKHCLGKFTFEEDEMSKITEKEEN